MLYDSFINPLAVAEYFKTNPALAAAFMESANGNNGRMREFVARRAVTPGYLTNGIIIVAISSLRPSNKKFPALAVSVFVAPNPMDDRVQYRYQTKCRGLRELSIFLFNILKVISGVIVHEDLLKHRFTLN